VWKKTGTSNGRVAQAPTSLAFEPHAQCMQAQLNVCKAVELWAFVVESARGEWGVFHVKRDLDEILTDLSCSSNAEY
jgi:hypothetical protein